MLRLIYAFLMCFLTASNVFSQATIPSQDKKGSKDSPLLKRYEGSLIVYYEFKSFDEVRLPLSKLEPVEGKTDSHNNRYHEPIEKKTIEGAYTRLVYLLPENRSSLEVFRNYQEEINSIGGKILFECKGEECGGDPSRSSSGGGGRMSLSMYLYPEERITDQAFSNGHCAITAEINNQRYAVAELPESGAYVSLLVYTLEDTLYCKAFNDRTMAVVDIIEAKQREQKMVTVKAEEMAKQISNTGSVALYGIYFDFNKADIKPESAPTLEQIAMLLKDQPKLKLLVVGHTDNVGMFSFNLDLSQRRANAVVNDLVTKYRIDTNRLTPFGVSFASPVASNSTEEGRAKNRRVELVEN
jgi:outer membrane protein OmpA-like peptidoglycan-associated protein